MRQYRVVEVMDNDGRICYAVQRKGWLFWRHAYNEWAPWGNKKKFVYSEDRAIEIICAKILQDNKDSALAKKRAAHKSKVVYGPYPP